MTRTEQMTQSTTVPPGDSPAIPVTDTLGLFDTASLDRDIGPGSSVMVSECSSPESHRGRRWGGKVVGAAVAGLLIVALAAYGLVTAIQSRNGSVGAATVSLSLTTTGAFSGSFTDDFSAMTPGAVRDRVVGVANTGSVALRQVLVTATGSITTDPDPATNVLSDPNGLEIQIYRCSGSYTGTPGSYACSGVESEVTAGPVRPNALSNLTIGTNQTAGATAWYRIVQQLPTDSSSQSQGEIGSLTYRFDGTQPTGGQR